MNETIGLIFSAYNMREYLAQSLSPWVELRARALAKPLEYPYGDGIQWKPKILICVVSVPFRDFDNGEEDGTQAELRKYHEQGLIDHLITEPVGVSETEARGAALQWLQKNGATISWQFDADEIATVDEILRILKFVERQPLTCWFRTCYKNYVFDEQQYLEEPFTPARIHRLKMENLSTVGFWDDNNMIYVRDSGQFVKDIQLSSQTVPKALAWIKHYSWLSNLRSKKKVAYQMLRWNGCSFKWNDEKNCLEFNLDYYAKSRQSLPKIVRE